MPSIHPSANRSGGQVPLQGTRLHNHRAEAGVKGRLPLPRAGVGNARNPTEKSERGNRA